MWASRSQLRECAAMGTVGTPWTDLCWSSSFQQTCPSQQTPDSTSYPVGCCITLFTCTAATCPSYVPYNVPSRALPVLAVLLIWRPCMLAAPCPYSLAPLLKWFSEQTSTPTDCTARHACTAGSTPTAALGSPSWSTPSLNTTGGLYSWTRWAGADRSHGFRTTSFGSYMRMLAWTELGRVMAPLV